MGGTYVVSTRVRGGRSLDGYPFNPCLTEAQYKEMEAKVTTAFNGLTGELKGTYYPLTGMTKEVQQGLIDDHFLFKEGDRFLQHANACRYWPSGRGIYHNDKKNFLVWVNEEDHLRIISMQMGGDLGEVYRRWVSAVNSIEKLVKFSHHDRLGFLTLCPTNLGTTVRASVHIKVPKLAKDYSKLESVAAKYSLQVRGTAVGIYAPDAEAYSVFSPLFDPVIEEYHAGFKQDQKHPACDFGDVNSLKHLDPEGTFVVSTRVRGGRSMDGYPFNPCLTEAQYKEMEAKVTTAFNGLEGELKGTYYPLTGMSKEVQNQLIDDHFLFKEGDRFLQHANACRYWPSGRGIYHNDKKNFLVWVNEEDHLRIIS